MFKRVSLMLLGVSLALIGGCSSMNRQTDVAAEKAEISKTIHASIGWAATKDTALVFSTFAPDSALFWFSPRDDGTVRGYDEFVDQTNNFFMLDEFKAVRYEIRDLEINLSRSGDVAWYHARLDDFNTWKGQPANWEDVRWTGVLEKRDNRWVIVQMHFSYPTEKMG